MAKASSVSWFYRGQVAARVLAAAAGGYLLTASLSTLLALLLPLPPVLSVAVTTMLSFTLYTLIIIWCFAVRRVRTVWAGLLLALLVSGGSIALLQPSLFIAITGT